MSTVRATAQLVLARARAHAASDFRYHLPHERIAYHPLAQRDASKLLIGGLPEDAGGEMRIRHQCFRDVADLIPRGSLMVRNDSRVIQARLTAVKSTGGKAEVLLLRPANGMAPGEALAASPKTRNVWTCMIGGKKIREGTSLQARGREGKVADGVALTVLERIGGGSFDVDFGPWDTSKYGNTFGELIEVLGATPLPPYIRRQAEGVDKSQYQTLYAQSDGLHMSRDVSEALEAKGVEMVGVTLHVGAGTFAPITGETVSDHTMHSERIEVSMDAISKVAEARKQGRPVVAVGTTSVRTLESLYWQGFRMLRGKGRPDDPLVASQWEPYETMEQVSGCLPSAVDSFQALLSTKSSSISGETRLLIVPEYRFQTVDLLITNFHQPESTLLMLVAAFLGDTSRLWTIYDEALAKDYRFLSYGDASLLGPAKFFKGK